MSQNEAINDLRNRLRRSQESERKLRAFADDMQAKLHDKNEECDQKENECQQLVDHVDKLSEELSQLQKQLSRKEEELDKANITISEINEKLRFWSSEAHDAKQTTEKQMQRNDTLLNQKEEKVREVTRIKEKLGIAEERIREMDQVITENEKYKYRIQELENAIRLLTDEIDKHQLLIIQSKTALDQVQRQKQFGEEQIRLAQSEITQLTEDNRRLQNELNIKQDQIKRQQIEMEREGDEQRQRQENIIKEALQSTQKQISPLQQRIIEMENENRQILSYSQQLEKEIRLLEDLQSMQMEDAVQSAQAMSSTLSQLQGTDIGANISSAIINATRMSQHLINQQQALQLSSQLQQTSPFPISIPLQQSIQQQLQQSQSFTQYPLHTNIPSSSSSSSSSNSSSFIIPPITSYTIRSPSPSPFNSFISTSVTPTQNQFQLALIQQQQQQQTIQSLQQQQQIKQNTNNALLSSLTQQIKLIKTEKDQLFDQLKSEKSINEHFKSQHGHEKERIKQKLDKKIEGYKHITDKEMEEEKKKLAKELDKEKMKSQQLIEKMQQDFERQLNQERDKHKQQVEQLLLQIQQIKEQSQQENEKIINEANVSKEILKQIEDTSSKQSHSLNERLQTSINENVRLRSRVSELETCVANSNQSVMHYAKLQKQLQQEKDALSIEVIKLKSEYT